MYVFGIFVKHQKVVVCGLAFGSASCSTDLHDSFCARAMLSITVAKEYTPQISSGNPSSTVLFLVLGCFGYPRTLWVHMSFRIFLSVSELCCGGFGWDCTESASCFC